MSKQDTGALSTDLDLLDQADDRPAHGLRRRLLRQQGHQDDGPANHVTPL
jgi:hypothetical protein